MLRGLSHNPSQILQSQHSAATPNPAPQGPVVAQVHQAPPDFSTSKGIGNNEKDLIF